MTPTKSAFLATLAASAASIAFPAIATAQDAEAVAEPTGEIVVSGLRQQYRGDVPLEEIPQTVQTISGEKLKELNITTLDKALDLASGVSRQNNFGGLWDSFAIRGFAGDENFPSGFLVNGFNGGRGYGGTRDASNIERVEILKGPNGAVFGRGEPGGTVNILTKKASLTDTFGSFAASAGSFDTYRVEGDYNLRLSDNVAIRVNGAAQDAGFVPRHHRIRQEGRFALDPVRAGEGHDVQLRNGVRRPERAVRSRRSRGERQARPHSQLALPRRTR